MGTAISRLAALALIAVALAIAGCGVSGKSSASAAGGSQAGTSRQPQREPGRVVGGGFAWLRPSAKPAGWRTVMIAAGAAMPYPRGWQRVAGDAGTATVVLRGAHDAYLGYLNLTRRQGDETLTNWTSFRVARNAREGDRNLKTLAAAKGLRFRSGRGSCVRDAYVTSTGAKFIELACLVAGARASSVIVGAAPPPAWARIAPSIERAISAFTT